MRSENSGLKTEEIQKRIAKIQYELIEKDLDFVWIEEEIDLYYLTGLELSAGQLLIGRKAALLLVDGRYEEVAKKGVIPAELATQEAILAFLQKEECKKGAFDGDKLSHRRSEEIQKEYPLHWVSWNSVTKKARMIKSAEEIRLLRASAALLWEGFLYIQTILKEGIKEKEVSLLFTLFCLEKGAKSLAFDPIIAFGEGTSMPHYKSGERKLKKGDVVLIDIGVCLGHYASDMTRVLFFGEKDPLLAHFLELTQKGQQKALSLAKPGVKIGQLDEAVRSLYREAGVEELFVHSLGHGIGLEVHESPRISFKGADKDLILEEGMVFTVEPGLYLPGKGGVRYEDTIVIENGGYSNFFEENLVFPI